MNVRDNDSYIMYLIEILKQRCLRELKDELEAELDIDPELITQLITERLSKFEDILPPGNVDSFDPTRCGARIWKDKRGCQCTREIKSAGLCLTHLNIQADNGYLRFGRYDETRPIINEKGNPIPWNDGIKSLDILFRYQRMNLHKLLKQRKITPQ